MCAKFQLPKFVLCELRTGICTSPSAPFTPSDHLLVAFRSSDEMMHCGWWLYSLLALGGSTVLLTLTTPCMCQHNILFVIHVFDTVNYSIQVLVIEIQYLNNINANFVEVHCYMLDSKTGNFSSNERSTGSKKSGRFGRIGLHQLKLSWTFDLVLCSLHENFPVLLT